MAHASPAGRDGSGTGTKPPSRGSAGSLRPVLLAAGACALIAVIVVPFLNMSLMPSFADRNVVVRLEGQPGTSNTKMTEQTTQVTQRAAVTARRGHRRCAHRAGRDR